MYLGESLTVMVFVKAVEHDAQSNNTHECKSTWKQILTRLSFTTSAISLVSSWVLTLKENQKTTWLRNASSFSQSCYYCKMPLCLKMFLGLNSGPEYDITIWHNFRIQINCSPVIYMCCSDSPYAFETIQLYVP